ncbi:MAG: 1-acyl-sn-glycerol-3-phosphate acyltransferase [Acidobacteria bacterium]|nr:1-acyl-sn-glycerol-3-phosphate acyltransferase [Acidobacteriota bacterium]
MKVVRWIRSAILVPVILVWTALMALLSLSLSLFDRDGSLQHGCAKTWARLILWISGVQLRVDSGGSISGSGPFVFISNHQSFFDIFALLAVLPVPFKFFAKASLFQIPFLGWHLRRAGHLPIDRTSARAAYRSFQSAAERVRAGASMLIFPEGSRSMTGRIGSFRKGSLRLALICGVPVVPVAICGSGAILPRGSMLISPGCIDISIGPTIFPGGEDLNHKDRFVEALQAGIVEQYRKLEAMRRMRDFP